MKSKEFFYSNGNVKYLNIMPISLALLISFPVVYYRKFSASSDLYRMKLIFIIRIEYLPCDGVYKHDTGIEREGVKE